MLTCTTGAVVLLVYSLVLLAEGAYKHAENDPCPDNFWLLPHVPVCLSYDGGDKTWEDARRTCYERGSDLVHAYTWKEMDDITYFLQNPPFNKKYQAKARFFFHWMGATNRYSSSPDDWEWLTNDGSMNPLSAGPTFWNYDEPSGREVCLAAQVGRHELIDHTHRWSASDCSKKRPFMCEIRGVTGGAKTKRLFEFE